MATNAIGALRTATNVLEGVGSRVVRGPDWKWGRQVSIHISYCFSCYFKSRKRDFIPTKYQT